MFIGCVHRVTDLEKFPVRVSKDKAPLAPFFFFFPTVNSSHSPCLVIGFAKTSSA